MEVIGLKKITLGILLFIIALTVADIKKAESAHHYLCTCYEEFADVKNARTDYYIDDSSIVSDDSFVAAQIFYVIEHNIYKSSFKVFFYNLADGKGWHYNTARDINGGNPVTYKNYSGHAMNFISNYYNQ